MSDIVHIKNFLSSYARKIPLGLQIASFLKYLFSSFIRVATNCNFTLLSKFVSWESGSLCLQIRETRILSGSCQAVVRQTSGRRHKSLRFVISRSAFGNENLFLFLQSCQEYCYFVTKIVLTYSEKNKYSSDGEKKINSTLKGKNLQNFWDHLNNLFIQWKVRTVFGNSMLF